MEDNEAEIIKDINKLDLLDRKEFVDKMLLITKTISDNKGNVSYAVNGRWGVGKSFVLDMFEEQIEIKQQDEGAKDKYSLFHYNCWSYDYYDEPLVAIVASMLDQIEANEKLVPEKLRSRVKATLKVIGMGLLSKAIDWVEDKTGVNAKAVVDTIAEIKSASDTELKEKYSFDTYFAFKKVLESLRDTLGNISKENTIVFVVDELDRCLPEYAIKVLERLHHMFEGLPNIQLIISLDKTQFTQVVSHIFGDKTDVDKYLAKFIDFEMYLDEGKFNDEFDAKFEYYLKHFDYLIEDTKLEDIAEFKAHIFDGMDMRTKIKLIDKCNLLHNILNPTDEKQDFAFMCIEVSFMIMKHWKIDLFANKSTVNIEDVFDYTQNGLKLLNQKIKIDQGELYYTNRAGEKTIDFIQRLDIWSVILTCYRYVVELNHLSQYGDLYSGLGLRKYSMDYRNLMYTIG